MGNIIIKKSALTRCFSVGFNSIKPVYTWNLYIYSSIYYYMLNVLCYPTCLVRLGMNVQSRDHKFVILKLDYKQNMPKSPCR